MDYVITAGDVSSGIPLGSDDSLYVDDGGTALATFADGSNIQNYGMTTGTTLEGAEEVNYGEADATTVYSGGDISTYGDISGTVADGGHVTIYSGGNAYGTYLSGDGAKEVVLAEDGTVSITTTIANGGYLEAIEGADIDGSLVVSSGGSAVLAGAGTTTNDDVDGGAEVTAGNTVSAIIEEDGGLLEEGSGIASGAMVSAGGTLFIDGAGVVGSDTNVGSGGVLEDGGTTTGTLLSGNFKAPDSAEEIVERGGVASGTLVYDGGYEEIESGGKAVGAHVQEYGHLGVLPGGSAVFTTMSGGPSDVNNGYLSISGVTTSTTLLGRATEFVDEGGVASHTLVSSGAQELVFGGTISGSVFYYAGRAKVMGTTDGNGSAVSAAVSAGGVLAIESGGFASYTTISFAGSESVDSAGSTDSSTVNDGGVEYLDAGSSVTDLVIQPGGLIDLSELLNSSGGSAVVTATGVLTVTEGKFTSTLDLSTNAPSGKTTAIYSVGRDNGVGTLVTLTSIANIPCFARGTAILTEDGARAVETLRIGDSVVTASGAIRPVLWIGHRRLDCRTHTQPDLVLPVRIHACAVSEGVPSRDLYLSPDHSLFIDGVLIPAKHLINGRSIAQIGAAAVEYWHVELDRHDVLIAEGLPCESYFDTGNRSAFANGAAHIDLHPDFSARLWDDACAELVQDGPRLVSIRQRLFNRSGIQSARPTLALRVLAEQRELVPEILSPGVWRFAIQPATRALHFVSPPWTPAEHDAASLDRRTLGVRLFGATVDGRAIELDGPALFSGFHPTEHTAEGACRWTTGDARLVLPVGGDVVTLYVGEAVIPEPARLAPAA